MIEITEEQNEVEIGLLNMAIILAIIGLIVTMMIILSISLASAMVAGTCDTLNFPNEDNVSVEFIGNSSNMNGFSYSKNGTLIEYCINVGFKPDNFTIRFYNSQGEVDLSQQPGGGSSYTKKKVVVVNETVNETVDELEEEITRDNQEEEDFIEEVGESLKDKTSLPVMIVVVVSAIVLLIIFNFAIKNSIKYSKKNKEGKGEED